MKRYIQYSVVCLLFFITADKIIGFISYNKLKSPNVYFYGEINKAISDTSKIFIVGSSRAACHYDSEELKLIYGKSVYNAGADGYGVFYSYAVLKERMMRNKPEIVVLDVEPTVLYDIKQFDLLTKLNAMTDIYPSFDEVVKMNPDHRPCLMFLNSFKYNSTLYSIVRKNDKTDSFTPLTETMEPNTVIAYHNPAEFSKEQKKDRDDIFFKQLLYLDKIYNLCKLNAVKIYFVTSPAYVDYDKDNILKAPLRKHFSKKGYSLINFTNDARFLEHHLLFKDQAHLNAKGAKAFTKAFGDTLMNLKKEKFLNNLDK